MLYPLSYEDEGARAGGSLVQVRRWLLVVGDRALGLRALCVLNVGRVWAWPGGQTRFAGGVFGARGP